MLFETSLYIALAVFSLGVLYKVSTWFFHDFSKGAKKYSAPRRIYSSLRGIVLIIFSIKIFTLIKVLILDVILQRRIFRESLLRWSMHICIFWGFTLLLLMHALEKLISYNIFSDYYSTLNPFLFLRTMFGLMIMTGLGLSFYRRYILKIPRLFSNAMDKYTIFILATIMLSGFFLEASKITSYDVYQEMVEDYSGLDEEEDLEALESLWVKDFGLVSPGVSAPFDDDALELGFEHHEMSCMSCHSSPKWAFISYGLAKAIKPAAVKLNSIGTHTGLWYIHFLACFIGLAYLPFSRFFHIFANPLSLLVNAVMDDTKSDPANILTRQMVELDACTHCGTCSIQCSVGISYEEIKNLNILPSEKLRSVKKLAAGKKLKDEDLKSIQEGLYLCTNCTNCTLVCPSGINLQGLWFNVREAVLQRDYPEIQLLTPLSFYRGLKRNEIDQESYTKPLNLTRKSLKEKYNALESTESPINYTSEFKVLSKKLTESTQAKTSFSCYTCSTCSNSCPVVNNFKNPREEIDLVPHQIIRATVFGFADMAFRSRMLWSCLGCYQCQEACPQGVRVTDIFYELKNIAIRQLTGNGA